MLIFLILLLEGDSHAFFQSILAGIGRENVMKVNISYAEIQALVDKMEGQQVTLEYVAESTVRVTAMVKVTNQMNNNII